MSWHLRIILQIIQSAIEMLSDSCIRTEYITLAVKLQRDAVGMGVVTQTGIDGSHQVVLLVHTRAHRYPRYIRSIEHRTGIFLDF